MARKMGKGGKGYATYMGHELEPPQPHGPKERGRAAIHSHSTRAPHKLQVGKRTSKSSSK